MQALLAYIVRLSMYSSSVHSSVMSDMASCVTAVHAAAKGETTAFISEPYDIQPRSPRKAWAGPKRNASSWPSHNHLIIFSRASAADGIVCKCRVCTRAAAPTACAKPAAPCHRPLSKTIRCTCSIITCKSSCVA